MPKILFSSINEQTSEVLKLVHTLGGRGGWDTRSGVRDQLGQHGKPCILYFSTKNTKISWAWWHTPVIPATREAEAGEWRKPGRWSLQ